MRPQADKAELDQPGRNQRQSRKSGLCRLKAVGLQEGRAIGASDSRLMFFEGEELYLVRFFLATRGGRRALGWRGMSMGVSARYRR